MEQKERSMVVTGALCVALFAGNWWAMSHGAGMFNYLGLWPVAFILCVTIATRIWHGHSSL